MKLFLIVGSLVIIVFIMVVLLSCLRISSEADDACNMDI